MGFLISNLSSIGLFVDIIGAVILWKFGLPATIDHKEFDAVMEHCLVVGKDADYEATVSKSKIKIANVKKYSRLGLGLLIFGFILQGFGNLVSTDVNDKSRISIEKAHEEIISLNKSIGLINVITIANKSEIALSNQKIQELFSRQESVILEEQGRLLESIEDLRIKQASFETKSKQNAGKIKELESRILQLNKLLNEISSILGKNTKKTI